MVVFTQYTDTLDYIRERLTTADYHSIGCYSGRGGEVYNPATQAWDPVTRADLKERFRGGDITILLGTDSMSEGLNLQIGRHAHQLRHAVEPDARRTAHRPH